MLTDAVSLTKLHALTHTVVERMHTVNAYRAHPHTKQYCTFHGVLLGKTHG